MIAMIALTQIQISPVLAYPKEETPLYPVSGSDVDNRTFEIDGHLVADGFAAAITMDLPVGKMESTHARVGFAVGLGDAWVEESYVGPIYVWERWTPFVKKMWLKVEGDGDYEPSTGAIVDNTGTGGTSTPDFWTVLELVMLIFEAYEIANFLMEVFQEPPRQEWKQELHSVEAIVRQAATLPEGTRLQTASAWFDNYFKRGGWNTLTITAGAEIACFYEMIVGAVYTGCVYDVGTYQVGYEVSFVVERDYTLTISASSGGTTDPEPGTYPYDYGSSVTVMAVATDPDYTFIYWLLDGAKNYDNPIGVTMDSDHTLKAQFIEPYEPGPNYPHPCPTLFVWDGSQYVEEATLDIHADSDVTLQHTIGETLVPEKNFYELSLRELDEFTSHIDHVKLYAVDSDDGETHETHLTNAIHSELGDVKEFLLHDDDTRVDLTPEQTIDLRFTLPNIDDDDVAYFIFEINGYNMKWPGDGP